MHTSTNLGLTVWDSLSDIFDLSVLGTNFTILDNQFSSVSVITTPIRFIEPVATVPTTNLSDGRLVYLTAADSGFAAKEVLQYNGSRWNVIGPFEIQSSLPTSSNYQGRMIMLSAAAGGFNQWDLVVNTNGANTWKAVGAIATSTTVAGFTNNFAGKLGVLTANDSGFTAYTLLLYNGTAWNAVDTRGVQVGSSFPGGPYAGQLFIPSVATGGFQSYELTEWNGSAWKQISAPRVTTITQFRALSGMPDGYYIDVLIDAGAGIVWSFVYTSGTWIYKGGAPLIITEKATITAFNSWHGSSPSIVAPLAGLYLVNFGGDLFNNDQSGGSAGNQEVFLGVASDGVAPDDEADSYFQGIHTTSFNFQGTGVAAGGFQTGVFDRSVSRGATFSMQIESNNSVVQAISRRRTLTILPKTVTQT